MEMNIQELEDKIKRVTKLKTIIIPILSDVCKKTTDLDVFSAELCSLYVISQNQMDECNHEGTEFKKNLYLYKIVMKKSAGAELIKALVESGNQHIVKIIEESYCKIFDKDKKCSHVRPDPAPDTPDSLTLLKTTILNNTPVKPNIKILRLFDCQFQFSELYKFLAQCNNTLETLEFNHFTIISDNSNPVTTWTKEKWATLTNTGLFVPFPNLKSLVVRIALSFKNGDENEIEFKNRDKSKKILTALLSPVDISGISMALSPSVPKAKSKLNDLLNLSKTINLVDIRIGGKRILYFDKAVGELVLAKFSYFHPNHYVKAFGPSLKRFSCSENKEKLLLLNNISQDSITELNLNQSNFSFKGQASLHSFLLQFTNLLKLTINRNSFRNGYKDCEDFDLEYIATAPNLKSLTLGNFRVQTKLEFTDLWKRFRGESLVFHNCNLESLKLHEGMHGGHAKVFKEDKVYEELIEISRIDLASCAGNKKGNMWNAVRDESNKWILYYLTPIDSFSCKYKGMVKTEYDDLYNEAFQNEEYIM